MTTQTNPYTLKQQMVNVDDNMKSGRFELRRKDNGQPVKWTGINTETADPEFVIRCWINEMETLFDVFILDDGPARNVTEENIKNLKERLAYHAWN